MKPITGGKRKGLFAGGGRIDPFPVSRPPVVLPVPVDRSMPGQRCYTPDFPAVGEIPPLPPQEVSHACKGP